MPNRRPLRPGRRALPGMRRPALGSGPQPDGPASAAESACYWLLYVVGLSGAYLHWQHGNTALALLCAVAVALAVLAIVRRSRSAG